MGAQTRYKEGDKKWKAFAGENTGYFLRGENGNGFGL